MNKDAFIEWMNNALNKKGAKRFKPITIQYYFKALDIARKEIDCYTNIFDISDIREYEVVESIIRNDSRFKSVNYYATKGMKGHLSAVLGAYRDFLADLR